MLRVVVTGGIGSGKSEVTRLFGELGAVVVDADVLAREVVAAGTSGLEEIVRTFGPDVVGPDGELDRPAMGRLVFGDEDARRRLEAIVHPLVFERIVELEAAAGPDDVVVHDIPLLAESGRADTFDAVIVVDADPERQLDRMTTERGWTPEDAQARMLAQASREERLSIATHVIENNGSLEDLRARVEEVYSQLVDFPG